MSAVSLPSDSAPDLVRPRPFRPSFVLLAQTKMLRALDLFVKPYLGYGALLGKPPMAQCCNVVVVLTAVSEIFSEIAEQGRFSLSISWMKEG
jgi:hypothetical protein